MFQKVTAEKTRPARYLEVRLSLYCQSEGGDGTTTCPPPPTFVLAPGSALGSLASVALSSGQNNNRISNLQDYMQNHKMQPECSSRFLRESTNTISSRFLRESTGIFPLYFNTRNDTHRPPINAKLFGFRFSMYVTGHYLSFILSLSSPSSM